MRFHAALLPLVTFSIPGIAVPPKVTPYHRAITETAAMAASPAAQALARKYGLGLMNLTWEDTARFKDSAVGLNISDMTIQVAVKNPKGKGYALSLMPVIRYDNFSDRTADVDPSTFTLLVGNEKDGPLKRISLSEFLKQKNLSAPRDTRVIVSAQACFLPVPKDGKATFNPVLFNYQAQAGDPAVVTFLVTSEGTSVTAIDNQRDALPESPGWGQRLFHNQNGKRASLTGQRISDVRSSSNGAASDSPNVILLVQVPLKQKNPMRHGISFGGAADGTIVSKSASRRSDVEAAVIGHGDFEGPFTGIDGLTLERDPKLPVRVTVQFYKATSNGVASDADLRQIKAEIDGVLRKGSVVGSLVTSGDTGRVTEYEGVKVQPADWWTQFWARHESNTGESREAAIARYRALVGDGYATLPVSELLVNDRLRR